ncbi:CaiB/BaiF CoA transferase family protein [Colwellia sp. RE-S-Sl-9]
MKLPLEGITVLEFSQYLAGPYAGLRLADLGARVIKIERPGTGDACRQLATKNMWVDGDSVLFHTINRNKESFSADLKNPDDLEKVKALIKEADVMTHNFRPGIMEKIGLDHKAVQAINPSIIYGEVSGYGKTGPWQHKPGQDLLAQSLSGLAWQSGNKDSDPVPFGLAVADMMCGTHFAQAILAGLVRRKRKGIGAHIEVSLMESIIDFQFEGLTTYLNNGFDLPIRSKQANAHSLLAAPYGIYQTSDGYLAIAMTDLQQLIQLIDCKPIPENYLADAFTYRDEIKNTLQKVLIEKSTEYWLNILEAQDIWCSDVYTYAQLLQHPAYKQLSMELPLVRGENHKVITTRCPIQLNGEKLASSIAAPRLGNANESLTKQFSLDLIDRSARETKS